MVEDIVKFKDLLQNAPLAYKSKYPIFIAKGNFSRLQYNMFIV